MRGVRPVVERVEPVGPEDPPVTRAQLEETLLANPSVDDCVVLERIATDGRSVQVVYIVAPGGLNRGNLTHRLRDAAPTVSPPRFVRVSLIPLTRDGAVDEAALLALPVLDEAVLGEWERRLEGTPRAPELASPPRGSPGRPHHMSDLVPGWSRWSVESQVDVAGDTLEPKGGDDPWRETAGIPAIVEGSVVQLAEGAAETLTDALVRAAENADTGIVYVDGEGASFVESYAALLDRGARISGGLRRLGLVPGDRVLVVTSDNRELLTAVWGCILGGCVPVPLFIPCTGGAAGEPTAIVECLDLLDASLVLSNPLLAQGLTSAAAGYRIEIVEDLLGGAPDASLHAAEPEDTALLLLTSGSTGRPKAVRESHRAICRRSAGTAQAHGFTAHDVSLNWFPLDHVVGLVMFHMRDVYLSSRQVHVATPYVLQDPLRWLELSDEHRVSIAWAPNFAYALVNERADEVRERSWDLSSLRFILNGGEAIVPRTARRFLELLSGKGLKESAMRPGWGMSETGSGVVFSDRFRLASTSDEDSFVELGVPIPGFSFRVVDRQDRVVAEGTTGHLQVRGDSVTTGYFGAPDLTEAAFTTDGWFRTGDLALIRDGQMILTDREKDVIIVRGINYHAHEIESAVEDLEGVESSYVGAFPIRIPGSQTDTLCVAVSLSPEVTDVAEMIRSIRGHLVSAVGVSPDYVLPVSRERIPKTAVGKLQRSKLRQDVEQGRLDDVLREVDLLTHNKHTLPNWFFRKHWRTRRIPSSERSVSEGHVFVSLQDDEGLGSAVVSRLEERGHRIVRVEAGSDFEQVSSSHVRMDLFRLEDHEALLSLLDRMQAKGATVIDLRTFDTGGGDAHPSDGEALRRWTAGLLALAKALACLEAPSLEVRLIVVGNRTQPCTPGDDVDVLKAPVLGLVRTLPSELSHVRCGHVDLPDGPIEENAAIVVAEALSYGRDTEVAYRDGSRWVPRLVPADLGPLPSGPEPFVHGGFYVVSGGLGGMAEEISGLLLERFDARLLLLGRTPLPPKESWPDLAAGDGDAVERAERYRRLAARGGEIQYRAVDVADYDAVRAVTDEASEYWSRPPDGVIHLAGVPGNRLVADETWESFYATLRPKVEGALALNRLVSDWDGAVFIASSSVNGFFGGYGVGAYAAANAFLDVFAEYATLTRTHVFAWSLWEGLGMSRGYELRGALERKGYRTISPRHGLDSMLAGMHAGERHLFVGLDTDNPHIRRRLSTDRPAMDRVVLRLTPDESAPSPDGAAVLDAFGTRTECEVERGLAAAGPSRGEVVADRAGGTDPPTSGSPKRGELERIIESVWGEVLDTEALGRDDNFFDLGGDSLSIAAVSKELGDRLARGVPMPTLYEYPTIALLASHLSQSDGARDEGLGGSDAKGRARRDRLRRRTRTRRDT